MDRNSHKGGPLESMKRWIHDHGTFALASMVCAAIAAWGLTDPDHLAAVADGITETAFDAIGWFFMGSVTLFLGVCLWLGFSRYGRLRLGPPGEGPEFSTLSWLSMLFAAGMGVGLVFWGVAEPLTHFATPPVGPGGTPQAARDAMVLTNFHWGLHAWGIYAMAGLVLAYFSFRKGTPYLPGSPIRYAFRGAWTSPVADVADFVGVIAVAIGVAGSLGMGVFQVQTGLHEISGVSNESTAVSVMVLLGIFIAYMLSASTGLEKGIRILSNFNIVLAVILVLFVLAVGPTGFLLETFTGSIGDYISALPGLSLRLFTFRDLDQWENNWTLAYFIFWIAWAPFVGIFIARISKGRTIREFVLGVLLVPTVFSMLWFAAFGGTAIHLELHGASQLSELVQEDVTVALFSLFEQLPLARLLSAAAVLLLITFLVTSADSATYVLAVLTSRGATNPGPLRKVTWGVFIAALAAALMFTGSIHPLRAVVAACAVPFVLIMLMQLVALLRELRKEEDR
jgi:glycine betaine transporter